MNGEELDRTTKWDPQDFEGLIALGVQRLGILNVNS